MLRTHSVSKKVIFILISCIILAMSVFGFIYYMEEKKKAVNDLKVVGKQTAERLSNGLTYPFWNLNDREIEKTIELEIKSQNIFAIILKDYDGRFYLGKIKTRDWKISDFDHRISQVRLQEAYLRIDKEIAKNGEVIGQVELYFTDHYLNRYLNKLVYNIIIQTLVLSVIIIGVIFFSLKKVIINPLLMIQKAVERFSRNDFNVRLPAITRDELGNLTLSLKKMADDLHKYYTELREKTDNLKQTQIELENTNKNLEDIIAARTDELMKASEELFKARKLESLGVLAGGIAHDFNNLLTGILGNISVAKIDVSDGDEIFETLSAAENACIRAQNLTQQLLTFSKGGAPIKKLTSIKDLIEESVNFSLSGSNIGCRFDIPEDIWDVDIDAGQMSQVINNLIINAVQAMPNGGMIRVWSKNIIVEDKDRLPIQGNRCVKISIRDEGIGISSEHISKIFDPYFSTKKTGSGLGLATAYAIIKNHDGYITAESEFQKGTQFNIYLPASPSQVTMIKSPDMELVFGSGRILLMDDEADIRKLAGTMGKMLGYEVQVVPDGQEAITMYKKAMDDGQPYDLVIMDLTIPGGMGGKTCIQKLLSIDPDVKAIVSSGYSHDPIMSNYQEYGFKGVIAKPYKLKHFARILSEVIPMVKNEDGSS